MFGPRLALPAKTVPVPSSSGLCALCVSAFSSLNLSPFNFKLLALFTLRNEGSVVEGSAFNCLSPKSHRITSFAYPHPLTPIESHLCKKQGEGVPAVPPLFLHHLATHRNADNSNLFMRLPYNFRAQRGGCYSQKEEFPLFWRPPYGTPVTGEGTWVTTHHSLLATHSQPLETPTPNGASLYMYVQERPGGPGTQVLDMRRFLIAVASLAVLPAIASAQRGGMGAGMAHPAMAASAPHVAMHASAPTGAHITSQLNSGTHYVSTMRYVRTRSGAIVARPIPHSTASVQRAGSSRQLLSQDMVPGLGFDYPHVAAVHPNGFHDRFRNRQFVGTFIPFFYGGGYYMPFSSDDYVDDPVADPQQADTGQPQATQTAQTAEPERPARQSRDYVPAPQTPSEKEAEQYVFVRRDGTVFFASAYAWENGTLRYITSEGLRHTVTADKLDLNATQQFNEQRGLNFRSPV
jgi:hypothetical protein